MKAHWCCCVTLWLRGQVPLGKPTHFPLAYVPVAPASTHSALTHTASLVFISSYPGLFNVTGANFIQLLHCKSEINLSGRIKETTKKHMSRKRLNGAPDMNVMALTQLPAIYRPPVDSETHISTKVLIVAAP